MATVIATYANVTLKNAPIYNPEECVEMNKPAKVNGFPRRTLKN